MPQNLSNRLDQVHNRYTDSGFGTAIGLIIRFASLWTIARHRTVPAFADDLVGGGIDGANRSTSVRRSPMAATPKKPSKKPPVDAPAHVKKSCLRTVADGRSGQPAV